MRLLLVEDDPALGPQVLQFLLPTGYEFENEWGFEVGCGEVAD